MATNLTNVKAKDSFNQLLHVDGGPDAAEKTVYSGTGTATALKVATGSASVDNIRLDGNTISTLDTNGNLTLAPNGTGSVSIAKVAFVDVPQARTALGLGSMATQNSGSVSITGGSITGVVFTGSFSGITAITSDAFYTSDAAAGLTLTNNDLLADGTDTNIDIDLIPKGTGSVNMSGKFGYPVGTGGSVVQTGSKSTGVTLNKLTGQITMDAASLTQNTTVSFILTNSFIEEHDLLVVNIKSGATADAYTTQVELIASGSCRIHLRNSSSGALAEAVVLAFAVIKGAIT